MAIYKAGLGYLKLPVLYNKLCIKKGKHVDHCVIDVFISVVDFMEGEELTAYSLQ